MSPPILSSRSAMVPPIFGTNTLANRKIRMAKITTIQTIWPGHWVRSNCGSPLAACSPALEGSAIGPTSSWVCLSGVEDDEGHHEGEDAHGLGHREAQEQHPALAGGGGGVAHRRLQVVAEQNAEASAGPDQAGHGEAGADELGGVNGFHVEKVPC